MKIKRARFSLHLCTLFVLILTVYKIPEYTYIPGIPFLLISYYRIFVKQDITVALILMLSARLLMGPMIPHSDMAFNILNVLCNYLPIAFFVFLALFKSEKLSFTRFKMLKYTVLYAVFLLTFSLLHLSYAISVLAQEILPLVLFAILMIKLPRKEIDFHYLLKFFRYSFVACVVVYLSPHFSDQFEYLFARGIVFKETVNPESFYVTRGSFPRNMGFVFDFRILGQLASIYLITLYYLNKTNKFFDVLLLLTIVILTFSRGPILIVLLLLLAIYGPDKIKLTKRVLWATGIGIAIFISLTVYSLNSPTIMKYVSTFNPFAEKSAISQRGMFIEYSFDKFLKNPLGNGIGSLSSPNADNVIFAGYTNFHKETPDPIYYYSVSDAYWVMSLAEKGIFGFVLMVLSLLEIFYSNRNRLSLFFVLGLFINMIGTDIPKQGFFYFVFIYIYFELSQLPNKESTPLERVTE